jgi:hypothetical protein
VGHEDRKQLSLIHFIAYWFNFSTGKLMFCALHSFINSLRSGLHHLTDQPNSQKGRAAKVEDGIISETKFLMTILVDRYTNIRLTCKMLANDKYSSLHVRSVNKGEKVIMIDLSSTMTGCQL